MKEKTIIVTVAVCLTIFINSLILNSYFSSAATRRSADDEVKIKAASYQEQKQCVLDGGRIMANELGDYFGCDLTPKR